MYLDKAYLKPDKKDPKLMGTGLRADLWPETADLKPDWEGYMLLEADFVPDRTDFRLVGAYFKPGRTNIKPEG